MVGSYLWRSFVCLVCGSGGFSSALTWDFDAQRNCEFVFWLPPKHRSVGRRLGGTCTTRLRRIPLLNGKILAIFRQSVPWTRCDSPSDGHVLHRKEFNVVTLRVQTRLCSLSRFLVLSCLLSFWLLSSVLLSPFPVSLIMVPRFRFHFRCNDIPSSFYFPVCFFYHTCSSSFFFIILSVQVLYILCFSSLWPCPRSLQVRSLFMWSGSRRKYFSTRLVQRKIFVSPFG